MFLNTSSLGYIKDYSQQEKVIIFKHSTACPVSAGAYQRLQEGIEQKSLSFPVYIVIVQDQRPLSNEIAEDLHVKHESPQCIVLEKGKAILVLNHNNITVGAILGEDSLSKGHTVCPIT
jgi:bacillithiol system protein YtxJ